MFRFAYRLVWAAVLVAAVHGCAVALTTTKAHAANLFVTCNHYGRAFSCSHIWSDESAKARVIQVPAEEPTPASEERAREFLRVCDPRVVTDSLGVERLVYARPGCDLGAPR